MVSLIMIRRWKKEEVNTSQDQISLATFLESYNHTIPADFPHASVPILKKFQTIYPTLFKNGDTWSVALHRKKVIDWLSSYRNGE